MTLKPSQLLVIFAFVAFIFDRTYPAKLLWFGEYTVVEGGDGLAGPLSHFYGQWLSGPPNFSDELLHFVSKVSLQAPLRHDLGSGKVPRLSYRANIPQGKGLGSSGALAAALYDLLTIHQHLTMEQKRSDLALIEAFWHGKGSGFDALVSLENAILRRQNNEIYATQPNCPAPHFYLLDSGKPRNTRQLVDHFKHLLQSKQFRTSISRAAEVVSDLIDYLVRGDIFGEHLATLSIIQYEHLSDFITDSLDHVWKETLDRPDLHLKLCGAGGGGYYFLISDQEIPHPEWMGFPLFKVSLDV